MNKMQQFDLALKEQEIGSVDAEGYTKSHLAYQNKAEWLNFVEVMMRDYPSAYKSYSECDGKELEENDGKPPKMASFASSSRMIYLAARDADGFCFERKLPTTVGGTANMDGFAEQEDQYIFVEAKCREPYTHKSGQIIGIKYQPYYEALNERFGDRFYISMDDKNRDNGMDVVFSVDGKPVEYFDIKQMLSHILGIATAYVKECFQNGEAYNRSKAILFLYYLYDPTALAIDESLLSVYWKTCEEICHIESAVSFKNLFVFSVRYLLEKTKLSSCTSVDESSIRFTFALCDTAKFKFEIGL